MMEHNLAITKFQVNGQAGQALADSRELRFTLCVEGSADAMAFLLFRDGKALWVSDTLEWQPDCRCTVPVEPCDSYQVVAQVRCGEHCVQTEMTLLTGMMDTPWRAQWIEPEQEAPALERPIQFFEQFVPQPDHFGGHHRLRCAQELRRVFTLNKLPKRAAIYATAHGVYTLWLNGQRVDQRRLAPETTSYPEQLYYQVYDLTNLLHRGENELRVQLADGWWIGRIGLPGYSCQYGDRLGFLGQMELDYGGYTKRIVTDGQFESRPSYIRYSDLFMGEKWDLTLPEQAWTPCQVKGFPRDRLAAQPIQPIIPWTTLECVSLDYAPNGELVADFGQCMAGVAELVLDCPAGTVVTLDHSETLDNQGNFFRNILGRNKDQQDMLICGEGEIRFCPEFTYHGFRYLRLDGVKKEQVKSLRALVIGTRLEQSGWFECSDPRINQLQHNINWSTRSNMVSVPTDCPQREKQGWTGDILAFASTGCFNYDLKGFLEGWLGQMRLEQTEDGGIPIVIPSYPAQTEMQVSGFGGNTSAAWSDACVLVPLELYRSYGDKQILRDNLAMMEGWLGFIDRATEVRPDDYDSRDDAGKERCRYLWTGGFHFGDWIIPSYQDDIMTGAAVTGRVIAACQYAVTVKGYIEVLETLEESEEKINGYKLLLGNIRRAIREEFVHEDGTITGDLQGMYVMVLYAGAVEGDLAERVTNRLVQLIEANGGCLDTGFVSVPHLLDVLTDHGREELAWKLLYQTRSPSWLYQVSQGATTIWENWNAIRPDGTVTTSSFNHYALGCVGDWIYRHIGGLRRKGPGWSAIEFAPDLHCGMNHAVCSYLTPYGRACCSWKRTGLGFEVEVAVPHGVRAALRLPGLEQDLTAGIHTFCV